MLKRLNQFTLMTVQHWGQIGAGKVVPFTPPQKSKTVPVPDEIKHLDPVFFEVCGDSFSGENIDDGQTIVARKKFSYGEVTPGRLCVVRVAGNEDLLKRVYYYGGETVRLASANPNYPDKICPVETVEILALVWGKFIFERIS
jgi:SOS-response transcriptional repressor LexA